jgi:transmembrane sensor
MHAESFAELFNRYLDNKLSKEEEGLFWDAVKKTQNQTIVQAQIDCVFDQAEQYDYALESAQADVIFNEIVGQAKVVPFYKRAWVRYAAAVLWFPLVLGAGIWMYQSFQKHAPSFISSQTYIAPGESKAVLTLADGTQLPVSSSGQGVLASQGQTKIVQLESGAIRYEPMVGSEEVVLYNTMTTPRGGQFELELPDGSKVWLNAASSIRYPTHFDGSERRVTVTGEAYFEVVADAKRPFKVSVQQDQEVWVLGTSFNVSAYENEPIWKTTLLSGSVKVTKASQFENAVILKPGQQARAPLEGSTSDRIEVRSGVNLKAVVAWKEGFFEFESSSLTQIMNQLERWYDVTVVYERNVYNLQFEGSISRNIPLQQLLKELEFMGIRTRLDANRVLVILP